MVSEGQQLYVEFEIISALNSNTFRSEVCSQKLF